MFAELGIPWHCGIDGGPGNHLLSSQVQCVNALFPMVQDPQRIQRAFGEALDIDEVLAIEPGRYLTFEYIGPQDYFNEGAGGGRTRGAHCTSFDAAFRYRTSTGAEELALVEWKYTESYRTLRDPNPARDRVRLARYGDAYTDPTGPLRSELLDIGWMFDEPFYQLMRQQLLAWQLERDGVEGLEAVRVLHVLPPANLAYQQSLPRHQHRGLGTTVDEVWGRLLGATDRFQRIDPAVFLDETVTCNEYLERYA